MIDEKLNKAVSAIVDRFDPREVILFGSRARGDNDEESDYDLLVIRDKDEPEYHYWISVGLQHVAWEALEHPVDVILVGQDRWNRDKGVAGTLFYDADQDGKVLYAR